MRLFSVCLLVASAGLAVFPSPGTAQDIVVRAGNVARLQLVERQVIGEVISLRRDTVLIRRNMDGPISAIAQSNIHAIEVKFPGSNRKQRTIMSALIGAAFGAAGGAYLATHVACADCVVAATDRVWGTLTIAGITSTLAAITGYITTPPRWTPATIPN